VQTTLTDSDRKIAISVADATVAHQHAMWGTLRALTANSIAGVSEGHICILRMVGVGYRATIEESATTLSPEYPGQKFVNLKLGFAHPVELGVPLGVKASTPQPTRILLEGCDKQVVTQFAAEIRNWRKPEPYKGKGIFVNDETIKLKAKKIK
jgi:large subunit ribosomal protein L6